MTTRLWLTGSTTPYTPATAKGDWNSSVSSADIKYLSRNPGGSIGTSSVNAGSTAVDTDVILNRFVSDGMLKAGVFGATASWMIGSKATSASMGAVQHVHIWVTQGNSDTLRGTLLDNRVGTTAFTTTATGVGESGVTLAPVLVSVGDRVVFEVGYRTTSPSSSWNATINYGGTQTDDLSSGSTNVTTELGWLDLTGADGFLVPSMSTLSDAFNFTIDSKWVAPAGVTISDSRAKIDCTTADRVLYSADPREIQSSQAAFQVPILPAAGGGTGVYFSAYLMPGPTVNTTNLEIKYSPNTGNLEFRDNVGGTDASPTTITYSSSSHQWWRFRESGGSIYMETSPDSVTWTTRRTISTMRQWMRRGNHILFFEAVRASGTDDFAQIDNVNPVSFLPPGIGTLRDNFNDNSINTALWPNNYGTTAESGGRARVSCDTAFNAYKSAAAYTLQGSHFTIRVYPPAASGAGSATCTAFATSSVAGTDAGFLIDSVFSAMGCYLRSGFSDGSPTFLTYNATNHAYLRLRETNGTLYWETSPDAATWTVQRSATTPSWASGGDIALLLDSHRDTGTNDYAEYDNLNQTTESRTKVWTGSAWVEKPIKVWNGSAWVAKRLKTYDGSSWI
jgi:hypothetical protein